MNMDLEVGMGYSEPCSQQEDIDLRVGARVLNIAI